MTDISAMMNGVLLHVPVPRAGDGLRTYHSVGGQFPHLSPAATPLPRFR